MPPAAPCTGRGACSRPTLSEEACGREYDSGGERDHAGKKQDFLDNSAHRIPQASELGPPRNGTPTSFAVKRPHD
jgi:hypothetical protein